MGSILFTDFHKLEQNFLRLQFTRGGVILITPLLDLILFVRLYVACTNRHTVNQTNRSVYRVAAQLKIIVNEYIKQ